MSRDKRLKWPSCSWSTWQQPQLPFLLCPRVPSLSWMSQSALRKIRLCPTSHDQDTESEPALGQDTRQRMLPGSFLCISGRAKSSQRVVPANTQCRPEALGLFSCADDTQRS